jgi:hypothetical protein
MRFWPRSTRNRAAALAAALLLLASPAWGAVERIEILERTPFAEGQTFGEAGAYEKIRGIVHFALDPELPANRTIADLPLAPRDSRGKVVFDSEFVLLRPVKSEPSTLLYDVNNRGMIAILGQVDGKSPVNNDPTTAADAGDGFLMRHGFSLLFSAWTWDVAPKGAGVKPLVFAPPVARMPDGSPIRGQVINEFTVPATTEIATYAGINGLTYEPATVGDTDAVLTRRTHPDDPRETIPRQDWSFVGPEQSGGPGRIRLKNSFRPGFLYEVSYQAQDPKVTAAGLAGIRDLLAWFRDHPFDGHPVPRRTLIFGISQSGRLIGRMIHDGLDVDESGRLAFDGAFMHVPGGGGSAGFNGRFVQPTRHPSMLEEHDYPADRFPFTTTPTTNPWSGRTASTFDRARDARGHLPKLFVVNTSTEFWNRDASLIGTTPDGTADVPPAPEARLYALSGAQHYRGRSRTRFPYVNCPSTTDHYLAMRALIVALDRWVEGALPPPSAFPSVKDRQLIPVAAYDEAFPKGIGMTPPTDNLHTKPFVTLVPAPDGDGNDKGGVRLIDLEVPLGTHTGWNRRAPETGFPWATARFDGSFVPFARTKAERKAAHDPRPSLEERYPTRDNYVQKVEAAADRQIAAGFLLPEDRARAVSEVTGLYDRILAHDPKDRSCDYLFGN